MVRLYEFVRESHQLSGQTALADRMGETPQTVNNWESESRGISQGGALTAQRVFGCDANWLLGTSNIARRPETPTGMVIASDSNGGWQWPFWKVSREAYALLTTEEKEHLEKGILLTVKNRGSPEKQSDPEYKIASG